MSNQNKIDVLIYANDGTALANNLNIQLEADNGHFDGIELGLSQAANVNPSPSGRTATSTTRLEGDTFNTNGWVRCIKCGKTGKIVDFGQHAIRFKRQMEAQKYTIAALCRIVTPIGELNNMRIASANFSMDGERPEELYVSINWIALDVAGEVLNSFYANGGLAT